MGQRLAHILKNNCTVLHFFLPPVFPSYFSFDLITKVLGKYLSHFISPHWVHYSDTQGKIQF